MVSYSHTVIVRSTGPKLAANPVCSKLIYMRLELDIIRASNEIAAF